MKKISVLFLGMIVFFGLKVYAADMPDADSLARKGNDLYSQNLLDDAVKTYKEALRVNPKHYEAQYNLALSLSDMNKLDEAIDAYKKAIRINSSDSDVHYNLANCYSRKGLYREAVAEYQTALKINPKDEDARANLDVAKKSLEASKNTKTYPSTKTNFSAKPSTAPVAAAFKGTTKQNFSPRSSASSVSRPVVQKTKPVYTPSTALKNSSTTPTVQPAAQAAAAKQNFGTKSSNYLDSYKPPVKASSFIPSAAASTPALSSRHREPVKPTVITEPKKNFGPNNGPKQQNFAPAPKFAAAPTKKVEPKRETYSKPDNSFTSKTESYSKSLAVDAYKTEKPKRAKDEILVYKREESRPIVPTTAPAFTNETSSFDLAKLNESAEKKKIEAAAMEEKKTVQLKADKFYNQGNVSLRSSRFQEAAGFYNQSLELRANDKDTHFNLAIAYERLNKTALAEQHYREALRLDPDFLAAQYNLAVLLYRQGHKELSKPYFESYVEKAPRDQSRQINAAKQALQSMSKQTPAL